MAPNRETATPLTGIVECDEMFIGGKAAFQRCDQADRQRKDACVCSRPAARRDSPSRCCGCDRGDTQSGDPRNG
jgi:hypothetical protein